MDPQWNPETAGDGAVPEPMPETQRPTSDILPREGGSIHAETQTLWQREAGSHDPVLTYPLNSWQPVVPVFETATHQESLHLLWDGLYLFGLLGTAQLWCQQRYVMMTDSSLPHPELAVISYTSPERLVSGARAVFLRG